MNKMTKHIQTMHNSRGFSLLEVLLGISVFMIGMLGVTALNISSMKSNTFSGNLTEATLVAASKIEELMNKPFDPSSPDCPDSLINPEHWFYSYSDWIAAYPDCSDLSDRDDDGNRLTLQDDDDDGMDDDDPDDTDAANVDNKPNFGLEDVGTDADYGPETIVKNNITYNVYWNVAENEPISLDPQTQRTKLITVTVEWFVKEKPRRISMSTIRQKE